MLRHLDSLSDDQLRTAYAEAVEWFVATVAAVPADGWDRPAGDRGTVAERVALAAHGFEQLVAYLDAPPQRVTFVGRTGRARAVFARPVPTSPQHLAERAEDTWRELRPAVDTGVRRLGAEVLARVAAAGDDAPCTMPIGTARLADELPGRVGEVVVHTLDVHKALGLAAPEAPALPIEVTLAYVAALADPVRAVLALTGRIGYDVFT